MKEQSNIILDGTETGFTYDFSNHHELGGGGTEYWIHVEDPKVKLNSTPKDTLFERLCGKLTRHRFALGLTSMTPFVGDGEPNYYCLCRICRRQFWTERRPKNMTEVPNEQ